MKTFVPLIVIVLLLAVFANRLMDPRPTGSIDSPLAGKPVPNLPITVKPPYIINFFASWCTPCAIEHPFLMKMKKKGVQIVGVAYKDKKEAIEHYLRLDGNPYTEILYDDKGDMALTMGITSVPESFAVDASGAIRARLQGPFADDAFIEEFLGSMK